MTYEEMYDQHQGERESKNKAVYQPCVLFVERSHVQIDPHQTSRSPSTIPTISGADATKPPTPNQAKCHRF